MPRKGDDDGTGIKLVDGCHVSSVTFQSMFYAEVNHYLIEVYDDKYKAIGLAVTAARGRYLPDEKGAFIRLKYLGSNNEHYQWYIENEGKPGGLPPDSMHHFCKTEAKQCKAKLSDKEVIHARIWAPLTKEEAHEVLVRWGFPGLEAPVDPPRTFEDEVDWGTEEEEEPPPERRGTTPKSRPDRPDLPRRRSRPPAEEVDKRDEEDRGRPHRTGDRKKADARGEGGVGKMQNALDDMLGDEPDDKVQNGLEDKLNALRDKLQGKPRAATSSGSKKPGGILAKRASDASGSNKKKKRKSHRSSGTVLAELTKAISKKRRHSDSRDSSGSSSDELEDERDGDRGGWEERRRKYKKIAENSPGKLMMQALENMQEQLGTCFGELTGEDEKLSPVVTRYLLTVIIPAVGPKNITSAQLRELRTIALAVDFLLCGRSDSCGDVLLQRFKSLCMQVRDSTDRFGPQIELLPEDLLYGYGGNVAETAFAREMALKEAKSDDLLRQARTGKST
eukprot:s868_g20.t1